GPRAERRARPVRRPRRRRGQRLAGALRALEIGDAGGRRGQLETRERAECLRGRDREIGRKPPLRARAVEDVAGERRHRWQRAPERREFDVLVKRVGNENLAGLEPRDLGRERITRALGDTEFARRYVERGDGETARLLSGGAAGAGDGREIIVASRIEE